MLSALIHRLLQLGCLSAEDTWNLQELTHADPVELALIACSGYSVEDSIDRRKRVFGSVVTTLHRQRRQIQPEVLWSHYIPLTDLIIARAASKRLYVVGIPGPPGVGKTSMSAILSVIARILSAKVTVVVSLDDFYLSPIERESLGYRWRAVPGTHDLKMLSAFVQDLRSQQSEIEIPRYDTRSEERLQPIISARPQIVFVEGWFVGAIVPGYEALAAAIEYLIYLHTDLEIAHQNRLQREATIRAESNGMMGLTEVETERFWQEALLPNITKWVAPLQLRADLTLTMTEHHRICDVSCRRV
jgi:D-glycerate 3-kinase